MNTRQIKFRVWHKIEKRWLDPWAEEDPMLCLKDFGQGCEVYLYNRDLQGWSNKNCQMNDVIIQQYVGFQDKDGKDIYEGDIIEVYRLLNYNNPTKGGEDGGFNWYDKIESGQVFWNETCSGFCITYKGHDDITELGSYSHRYKIIGNIFDEDSGLAPK